MIYGYNEEARRIAKKYVESSENMFKRIGKMWEKYNVLTGDNDVVGDYYNREMLGRTAGVYLFCKTI